MANKKYVIMRRMTDCCCPIIEADDNRAVKELQKKDYKIIGRVSCKEGFIPNYAVVDEAIQTKGGDGNGN